MPSNDDPASGSRTAWRWLLLNLLVLPGWGSIKGGHRVSGWCQLVLGLAGLIVSTVGLYEVGMAWIRSLQTETALDLDNRLVGWITGGAIVFLCSWLWALGTGLQLLRKADNNPPPPPR